MKKFEEEYDKFHKENHNMHKTATEYHKALKQHFKDVMFLEDYQSVKDRLKECEDLRIEANNKAAKEYTLKCEVVEERAELKREIEQLKSQLEKQQPEIPQFVAEYARDCERELSDVLDEIYMETDYLEDHSTRSEREGLIARYWLYNRTVAKEKRFYLKNRLTGDCLARCLERGSDGLYVEVTEKWLTRKEQTSYKLLFTQQEIDSMETGSYEQIGVEE